MKEKDFKKLINTKKYQVFLFTCNCRFPLSFARHPWFVVNKKGKISRWEIVYRPNQCKTSWNHLHLNLYKPSESLNTLFGIKGKTSLIHFVEGGEKSLAHKMTKFIENSPKKYIFNERYSLTGPNSNTYAQWILDNHKKFESKLPINSFGKNFDYKSFL